jgi:hypothetical protein
MKFEHRYTPKTIPQLSPAEHCFLCDMPTQVAQGRRIVATSLLGMRLAIGYTQGRQGQGFYFSSQLNPSSNLYLQYWSDTAPMTPALLHRARSAFLADKHPWFCHVCAKRSCHACGAAMGYPMASDVLNGEHKIVHVPIFPIHPGCVSKTCVHHRPLQ